LLSKNRKNKTPKNKRKG